METYENKIAIESCIKTIHKQQYTEHKVQSMIDELEMVYDKAKAFDEILDIDLAHHDEEYADNAMKVVNKYTEDIND